MAEIQIGGITVFTQSGSQYPKLENCHITDNCTVPNGKTLNIEDSSGLYMPGAVVNSSFKYIGDSINIAGSSTEQTLSTINFEKKNNNSFVWVRLSTNVQVNVDSDDYGWIIYIYRDGTEIQRDRHFSRNATYTDMAGSLTHNTMGIDHLSGTGTRTYTCTWQNQYGTSYIGANQSHSYFMALEIIPGDFS